MKVFPWANLRPKVCPWEHFHCTILRLDLVRVLWKNYMPCHMAPPANVPTTLVLPRLDSDTNKTRWVYFTLFVFRFISFIDTLFGLWVDIWNKKVSERPHFTGFRFILFGVPVVNILSICKCLKANYHILCILRHTMQACRLAAF